MQRKFIFLLCSFVSFCSQQVLSDSCYDCKSCTKSCSDDPDYSYVLALMHPQGNWNVNFQVPQWTIHGLWPSIGVCCKDESFNLKLISKNVQQKMEKYWPSLWHNNNSKFWAHEWVCHGTCALGLTTEEYFNTTLNLYDMYDIFKSLESNSIIPNDYQTYKYSDVINAVASYFNANPIVKCCRNRKESLKEIRLCLSSDFTPTDCQNDEKRYCNENIHYYKGSDIKYTDECQ